jgi:hypothetical protein
MREALRTIIGVYLIGLAVAGCATLDPVDTGSASAIREKIEVNDRAVLITRDERRHEIRIVDISDREVIGTDETGETIAVAHDEIESLHVRQSRPGRTAGAVVGVAVVTAFAVQYPAVALAGILIGSH